MQIQRLVKVRAGFRTGSRVGNSESLKPTLDWAVNKRLLSTRETGEFAGENVGFGLNPGVAPAHPRSLSSNRRKCAARENLLNVADTGQGDGSRCCQQHAHFELGQNGSGSIPPRHSAIHSRLVSH